MDSLAVCDVVALPEIHAGTELDKSNGVEVVESSISSPSSPAESSKATSSSPIPQSSSRTLAENSKSICGESSMEMEVWTSGAGEGQEGGRCGFRSNNWSPAHDNNVGEPNDRDVDDDVDDKGGWAVIGNNKDGVPNEGNTACCAVFEVNIPPGSPNTTWSGEAKGPLVETSRGTSSPPVRVNLFLPREGIVLWG